MNDTVADTAVAKPAKTLAAPPTVVTMDDGRLVEFSGKTKLKRTTTIAEDGTITIGLDFVNGEFRQFVLPPSLLNRFAAHGASQKIGDEIAGLDDVDDAILAIDTLTDRLSAGEWTMKREAGQSTAGTSVLAKALIEHSKKTVEQVRSFLASKNMAEKAALRNNPALVPIIARLEANKKKKVSKVDTNALLEELV